MKVEIDRAKWGRSSLLRPFSGKMCCLGFVSLQAGLTEEDITDRAYPAGVWDSDVRGTPLTTPIPELLQPFITQPLDDEGRTLPGRYTNTELARDLARINDSCSLSDSEREAALIARASQDNFEFVFTGERHV